MFKNSFRVCLGVLFASICSCSDDGWSKLSESQIRSILPELSLLEATASFRDMPDSIRQRLYDNYFDSRGITQSDWDSTMAWYAKHQMVMYEDFYRMASEDMERTRIALQTKKEHVESLEQRELQRLNGQLDSVNLLRDTLLVLNGGDLLNQHWVLRPSTFYQSGTRLTFSFNTQGLQSNIALRAELRMHATDSTMLLVQKTECSNGETLLSLTIPEGKTVELVTALIRGRLPYKSQGTPVMLHGISIKKYPSDATVADTHEALVTEDKLELSDDL